jgi:TetR/AcrR family transcriptional repressor of nem operon
VPSPPGRPRGFDRDEVLDAVVDTFWVHGYAGTTTSVLESGTGLSRSSLLNTFGPKDQLCLAAVDRYQERLATWLVEPLSTGRAGVADVEVFFQRLGALKKSAPGSSGCLVVNLSTESPGVPPGLRTRVDRYRRSLRDAFAAALSRAEQRREVSSGQVDARAEVLLGLAVAVNWTARSGSSEAAAALAATAPALLADWAPR